MVETLIGSHVEFETYQINNDTLFIIYYINFFYLYSHKNNQNSADTNLLLFMKSE